jgi:hypothetical protein
MPDVHQLDGGSALLCVGVKKLRLKVLFKRVGMGICIRYLLLLVSGGVLRLDWCFFLWLPKWDGSSSLHRE